MKLRHHTPLIAIAAGLCLFFLATRYYPGGTSDSDVTVGYSWTHNFISSLFASHALNGSANPARYIAIPAMLLVCVGLALMFRRISASVGSRVHRKLIEIGGIGSMVYAFLVVTPMHDLMVSIALLFALVALIATLHALYVERLWLPFAGGAVCIALLSLAAVSYYGKVFYGLLPLLQKASMAACVGWLSWLQYRLHSPASKPVEGR